tara:strand:- start:178 stop:450 length:273 start_codon:yes stop_codon:yes gene_type:complete
MFFLLFLLCSAAMAEELAAIVYSDNSQCVTGATEIWVSDTSGIQESVGKLTRAEAKDFTVTDTLKVTGDVLIGEETLQKYITGICNSVRL